MYLESSFPIRRKYHCDDQPTTAGAISENYDWVRPISLV